MLGKIHLFSGIIVVVIFTMTGQYMQHSLNELKDVNDMNRALIRAGHLYILLFGLVNAALGISFKVSETNVFRNIQYLGSTIIILSTVLIVLAFFIELPSDTMNRPMTQNCLKALLAGVAIHGMLHLYENRQ